MVYATAPRRGVPRLSDRAPCAVVLIDLDEFMRMLSSVTGCPLGQMRMSRTVRATWEPLSEGPGLPLFEPLGN